MKIRVFHFLRALLLLLAARPGTAQNLLSNPDFSAGNAGFTSAYRYVPAPGPDPGAGSYTIGTDNRAYNPNFLASYGDHTTGSGPYMIVNAATTAIIVWEQTVTGLQANKPYQFSFWLLNTYPTSKARMQVSANGVDVGAAFINPNDGGNWQLNTVTVNPGAGTQLILRLRDLNLDDNGNDFGLDDMALTAPVANARLTANAVTTASISTAATINATAISPLSATITGPAGATVASFTLATVPAAAAGVLRIGSTGPALSAGQVLTAAQGSQLYFSPTGATTQNATFTYTATDSNGNFSANSATYTIPLAAPAAPMGCGPAYGGGPARSGLAADYYPGYFNDDLSFFSNTIPGLTRFDPQLNFASTTTTAADGWGPIIPPATAGTNATDPDNFSTRHRGSVYIPTAGDYTFYLKSDDASYLWLDGAVFQPSIANATINNGKAHATATVQATVTLSAGWHNLLVYYGEATGGNVLTLEYSSTAGAGISRRIVPNAALCAGRSILPPVATAVTNAPAMPNSNGPTAIAALAGTDPNAGGSVTRYVVSSLPPAASGILYVGTNPATANQGLTVAEAATLNFDPAAGFSGNATFQFFAVNNAGVVSNLPATYTIPVVGPVADVTTALSGPTTLGAGLSSGTFTATFTNNGPQAAELLTQTVRLPTGASMTAAQQAALPAPASYNAGTNTIDFGTVAVVNSGTKNTYTFSFTVPTTQGANSLVSTVGTSTSQGTNAAPDRVMLSVAVNPGNFFVTSDDSNEVPGNGTKSGNVILNDSNPANLANGGFTATLVTGPSHGALVLNPNGSYRYTPAAGYLGSDSFTYQVCVPGATPPCSNSSTVSLNVYDASAVCTIGTGTNLLANPSFSSGNTGFVSTYKYVAQTYIAGNSSRDGLVPEATYTVANNAGDYHPSFTGTGRLGASDNFMIVNGSQNLSVVYQQTLTVRPNTYYSFSAYASSVNPASPAQLGFVINGKSTSAVTTLDGTTGYVQISDLWFSGNTTNAVFEIRDVNKDFGGNDFGLDDIYFGTCAKGLTADNVTTKTISNSAPAISIPALSGTVSAGPALSSFTIQTLPAAAAGILYLNKVPVIPGQVIPVAQADNLFFDPVANFVGTGSFTYTATDASGAGSNNTATYAMPIDSRPLPVQLVRFTAKVARTVDTQLSWNTASERNSAYFEVQRSADGHTFASLAQVRSQGNSTVPATYGYTDAGIGTKANGLLYYRLRQVDRDGTFSDSPVRTVQFGAAVAPAIALSPNPASATTHLDLTLLPIGTYQVRVLDNLGRKVLRASGEGGAASVLDTRSLANGLYLVQVRGASGQQFVKRLTKE